MMSRTLLALSMLFGATSAILLTAFIVAHPSCSRLEPADAIVVLGARVGPGGQPSPPLRARAERAAELWNAGLAPTVIPTGGLGVYQPTEARAMADVMLSRGVDPGAIVLENRATSTEESAYFTEEIAAKRGLKRIILVSDPYHLIRASWLFHEHGFQVQIACTNPSYIAGTTYWYQAFREVGGLMYHATTRGWLNADQPLESRLKALWVDAGRRDIIAGGEVSERLKELVSKTSR